MPVTYEIPIDEIPEKVFEFSKFFQTNSEDMKLTKVNDNCWELYCSEVIIVLSDNDGVKYIIVL